MFDTTERSHRAFVGLSLKDVNAVVCLVAIDVGYEGMRHALYVVVPVTVIQICDETACSLWQVIRILPDAAVIRETLDEDHLAAIG